MTLILDERLLGAIPSPFDARDFALAVDLAAPLPSKYRATLLAPVLNQLRPPAGEPIGTCVGQAATGMKQQQERAGGDWPKGWPPLDAYWLYHRAQAIDGFPLPHEGTTCRAALSVLRHQGEPLTGKPATAPTYVIVSYAAVTRTYSALKAAIHQYGPLLIASAWYRSWFNPVAGILPKPSGGVVGGHAELAFGWDDSVAGGALLVRNSWGKAWGSNGNFYAPASFFIPTMHDAWRATDK